MKIIKYDDIKTPETIEEFRTNLKKYYYCIKNDREQLYVQTDNHFKSEENDKHEYKSDTHEIDINTIEDLSELYHKLESGIVRVIPTINFDVKSVSTEEILGKNNDDRTFRNVFRDQSRFVIYEMENKDDVFEFGNKNPYWYGIDNKILRSFYAKTLGEFSGYTPDAEEKSA